MTFYPPASGSFLGGLEGIVGLKIVGLNFRRCFPEAWLAVSGPTENVGPTSKQEQEPVHKRKFKPPIPPS